MTRVGRRTVLQALAGIPFLGRAVFAFQGLPKEEVDKRTLALRMLRMVNTAELWHKLEFGSYVDLAQLMKSPAFKKLRDDPKSEKFGIGATLLSQVSLDGPEVLPGWESRVWPHGSTYVTVVRQTSGVSPYAFASDESGVIYEGVPVWSANKSEPHKVEELLRNAIPLRRAPDGVAPIRRGLDRLLNQATFLTLASYPNSPQVQCCCACGPPACMWCAYGCEATAGSDGSCMNCGCWPKPWLCCTFAPE